jgi:hypothetical protein
MFLGLGYIHDEQIIRGKIKDGRNSETVARSNAFGEGEAIFPDHAPRAAPGCAFPESKATLPTSSQNGIRDASQGYLLTLLAGYNVSPLDYCGSGLQ